MKFIEVSYHDLKLGAKYIIINNIKHEKHEKVYVGTFTGYCNKYSMSEITHWGKTYAIYLTNWNIKYVIGDLALNRYTFKRRYMILDSQKETIQNNMEARALNIILRELLGDNNFCY